jgi:uncharacterized surface anchored protein
MPRNTELKALRDDDLLASVTELNKLDNFTGTFTDLNRLVGMTAGQNANSNFIPTIKATGTTVTSGSYDVTKADINSAIVCDSTAGNVNIFIPTDAYNPDRTALMGQLYMVVNVGTANNVIVKSTAKSTGQILFYGLTDNNLSLGSTDWYLRPSGAALLLATSANNNANYLVFGSGVFLTP